MHGTNPRPAYARISADMPWSWKCKEWTRVEDHGSRDLAWPCRKENVGQYRTAQDKISS